MLSGERLIGQGSVTAQQMFLCSVRVPVPPSRPALIHGGGGPGPAAARAAAQDRGERIINRVGLTGPNMGRQSASMDCLDHYRFSQQLRIEKIAHSTGSLLSCLCFGCFCLNLDHHPEAEQARSCLQPELG
jgi:hypothetical protein